MVVKISVEGIAVILVDFILSSVHVSSVLVAVFVLVVLWIVRKTKVVRSTAMVIVPLSAH